MIKSPVPTRAEVSDVANAILDGTDAIMLSEETTLGEYPVEAIKMMSKIAKEVERELAEKGSVHSHNDKGGGKGLDVTDSITGSVVQISHNLGAKALIALTHSGFTARMISRHKPKAPIFAMSSNEKTVNQMCLSFGCEPILIDEWKTVAEAYDIVRKICLEKNIAIAGDKVVIASGAPTENALLETNMILVETI
jgi:pyruvate kinase